MSRCSLLALLTLCFPPLLAAQSLDHAIPLVDGDPASLDYAFGIALSADGTTAYAAIAGDLFPQTANNDNVARLDVIAGSQTGLGQTQAYPEDVALTYDAAGNLRHVFVANSTTGSVSCLTPALAPVATIPLPLCFGGSSYPFGLLVSPDQSRVYVTTIGGCGDVHALDSDPASPGFNTVVASFVVPNGGGRPSWSAYPVMVVPMTAYDAGFSYSVGGFAVVDVLSPASQTSYSVSPPTPTNFAYATECVVIGGGKVLVSIGGDDFPIVYECSIATGAVLRTLNLNTITGPELHGLATNPDGTVGAVTSINGGETVFFDLATFSMIGLHDHGSTARPNDVVFTPDGSRAVVSLQGDARVDVLDDLPWYALKLAAPAAASVGGALAYTIDNVESGRPCAIFASLAGGGPQQVGPYTVHLSDPVFPLHEAVGDLHGDHTVTFTVPNVPGLPGLTVWAQAATVDRDGGIRLSNGVRTTIN
jgi:DNA-binding beta-propeller fold protein YncE